VALAAIQGLNQKLEAQAKQKDAQIADLKQQNAMLEKRLDNLEQAVKTIQQQK
jgi:phage shock protein A